MNINEEQILKKNCKRKEIKHFDDFVVLIAWAVPACTKQICMYTGKKNKAFFVRSKGGFVFVLPLFRWYLWTFKWSKYFLRFFCICAFQTDTFCILRRISTTFENVTCIIMRKGGKSMEPNCREFQQQSKSLFSCFWQFVLTVNIKWHMKRWIWFSESPFLFVHSRNIRQHSTMHNDNRKMLPALQDT